MSNFTNKLKETVVNGALRSEIPIHTVGVVTKSDELNNTVSLYYVDKDGQKRTRDNVVVRLYGSGTDYFPAVNDSVIVEETRDTCVVIARHISNYAMDVRSKMKLVYDILSDMSPFGTVGGTIF